MVEDEGLTGILTRLRESLLKPLVVSVVVEDLCSKVDLRVSSELNEKLVSSHFSEGAVAMLVSTLDCTVDLITKSNSKDGETSEARQRNKGGKIIRGRGISDTTSRAVSRGLLDAEEEKDGNRRAYNLCVFSICKAFSNMAKFTQLRNTLKSHHVMKSLASTLLVCPTVDKIVFWALNAIYWLCHDGQLSPRLDVEMVNQFKAAGAEDVCFLLSVTCRENPVMLAHLQVVESMLVKTSLRVEDLFLSDEGPNVDLRTKASKVIESAPSFGVRSRAPVSATTQEDY